MSTNKKISTRQPNHDIAELYLSSHGWIPVDPNLGKGQYSGSIGFGRLGNSIILLNREGAWVWSTWLPPNGYDKSASKPKLEYDVTWTAEVKAEGRAADLFAKLKQLSAVSPTQE